MKSKHKNSDIVSLLGYIISGLIFGNNRDTNPYEGVDIEKLIQAVNLLSNKDNLEISPFVASWHPQIEKFDILGPSEKNPIEFISSLFKSFVETWDRRSGSQRYSDSRYIESFFSDFKNQIAMAIKTGELYFNPDMSLFKEGINEYLKSQFKDVANNMQFFGRWEAGQVTESLLNIVKSLSPSSGGGNIFKQLYSELI